MVYWIVLSMVGFAFHVFKHMVQANSGGKSMTLRQYLVDHKWQTWSAVAGTVALFIVGVETETMNSLTAFSVGIMGNSAADIIGKRADAVGGR